MIPAGLGSETITVLRAPEATDSRDGSKYRDWSTATSTVVIGCMVQPFLMSNKLVIEDSLQREFTGQFFRIWAPGDTDIEYTDRIVWRGRTMDVYGDDGPFVDFEGNVDHIQFVAIYRRG